MVYYIKFNADDEPKQFTTASEAKENIEADLPEGGSVLFAFAEDAPENLNDLEFVSFDDKEAAREAVDKAGGEEKEETE